MVDQESPTTIEELLFRLTQQTNEHAVILLDVDGRIRWWNPAASAMFGIPLTAAAGLPMETTFVKEDIEAGLAAHERRVAAAGVAADDDRWLMKADGRTRFWATGVLTALRDDAGEVIGFGKVLRNRTDLREQLDTLRNEVEEARAESRHKDVFLSTLSHELRNPLAPLTHAAELIRMMAPDAARLEPVLQIIERQTATLRRLVDDLLDVSRIGAGKIEITKTTVALRDVIQRAVESARPAVDRRRHTLDVLLPPVPLYVEADAGRLEQVFVNLINNAAKFTPEGGRIWINGTIEGAEAVIAVEDTGVGIPHDMLPRIFDLFTQVETSRGQSQGGLGIGLALVKSFVALNGGSIQVRSEGPGTGSQFIVRLPLKAR